jgi:plastocyanin
LNNARRAAVERLAARASAGYGEPMRLFALCFLVATGSFAQGADAPAATGKVSGKVIIAGLAPKLPPLPVTKDSKICGVNKADEALVIGTGGGIRNAVVWIAGAPPAKDAARALVKLDQQACRFEPHVAVLPAGGTLEVVNSDPVLHHPRAQVGEQKIWEFPMPLKGHTVARKVDKVQTLRVTCESHPWMRAFVQVLDSAAYAVTDEQGHFSIANAPTGKQKLKLWHERLGEREESIEVAAGETVTRDITLAPR